MDKKSLKYYSINIPADKLGVYNKVTEIILFSWGLTKILIDLKCLDLTPRLVSLASQLYEVTQKDPYLYLWSIFLIPGDSHCQIIVEDINCSEFISDTSISSNLQVNLEIVQICRRSEVLLCTRKEY